MAKLLATVMLCWLALNPVAYAQTTNRTAPLNTVLSAPEVLGSVPNHFFWLRSDLQAVQDPVDQALVFLNNAGRVLGRAAIPPDFRIGNVIAETDQVKLIDESKARQIVVGRTVDPATIERYEASAISGLRATTESPLSRRGSKRLILGQALRSGEPPLELRSISDGTLADAYDVGTDLQNNRYVVTEEITSSKSGLKAVAFMQRFDQRGKLTGRASIPMDQMDIVPRGFATVTDAGIVRILVPKRTGVVIQELSLLDLGRRSAPRNAVSTGREFPVETNVIAPDGAGDFTASPGPRSAPPATPPIRRSDILAAGRAYLNVNWVMHANNFSKPGIDSLCVPAQWKHWKRPNHFTSSMIGQQIGPMPYWWGGDDTPASFLRRTAAGALDCRQCVHLQRGAVQSVRGGRCSRRRLFGLRVTSLGYPEARDGWPSGRRHESP